MVGAQAKPLVVVRAVILGLLMPAFGDPRKDREVFLATKAAFADTGQDSTLVRHALYATWRATDTTESLAWLRTAPPPNYHGPARESAATVLRYLVTMDTVHWEQNAAAAKLVAGAVENDHV